MKNRSKFSRLVSCLMLVGFAVLLSGCTFWVKTADGKLGLASVSDQEIMRFTDKMERLTLSLLQETRERREQRLSGVVTEIRMYLSEMTRKMGQKTEGYVDLGKLEAKVRAFELQMGYRINEAPDSTGMKSIRSMFQQVQAEVSRFKALVERSIR